ncbi:MAG: hypothetical protein KJ058_09675 [Thermoanaerobaculia bacterium]|nr:hypothetical protein [Thermoanaerobaculia bacterium]MCZ7652030.1 hypothetical protein [Thermoanaerobaculia bacterium]
MHRTAGTGDVAFRLAWRGASDLDLFVRGPEGPCIFFFHRASLSGGRLDIDCNAAADRLCDSPVENVFWPRGTAPDGEYLFWVHAHSLLPEEAPVRLQLQVLRGTEAHWIHRATASAHDQVEGPFRLVLRDGWLLGRIHRLPGPPPPCFPEAPPPDLRR